MKLINLSTMRAYNAIPKGSYIVLLVGEIRSGGKYYSMFNHLNIPGELYQTYIKIQHNTWSGRNGAYRNNPRALTAHEMIAVIKKPSGYEITLLVPTRYKGDLRDIKTSTWKDIVSEVLRNIGEGSSLDEIYSEIEGHKKTETNQNWRAKVRQILQQLEASGLAEHVSRGTWKAA